MKIGLFLGKQSIKGGGLFTYTIGLLKVLINTREIDNIVLYYSKLQSRYLNNYFKNSKVIPVLVNDHTKWWKICRTISKVFSKIYSVLPHQYEIIMKLSLLFNPYNRIINSNRIDIFHVPFQFSPIYGIKIPVIVTMHDFQELHYPEFFTSSDRRARAVGFKKSIDKSNHIIVSFNHVKQDILRYFEVENNKITVFPLPFAEDWFSTSVYTSKKELEEKYDLPEEYILYPAATWKHKNHTNLIKAISYLKGNGKSVFLVCTGNKTEFFEQIEKEIINCDLKSEVKFLGIVPEEDLIGLYHYTKLVVVPTLYEAGSGPLFEAMRYNVPVICSNVTSLPESINNEEFVFNPNSIKDIAKLIEKGCFDKEYIKRNIDNSKKRMEYYKNQNYKNIYFSVYKNIIK